ncbi:MAG: hypothetical protein ACRDP6_19665 [Actinoallomurus sp.]
MAIDSPNGAVPYAPRTITVDELPRIYALCLPEEDDEVVAWGFNMPGDEAVLVIDGHVIVSDDAERTGRRYARIMDAELAVVRQCQCR